MLSFSPVRNRDVNKPAKPTSSRLDGGKQTTWRSVHDITSHRAVCFPLSSRLEVSLAGLLTSLVRKQRTQYSPWSTISKHEVIACSRSTHRSKWDIRYKTASIGHSLQSTLLKILFCSSLGTSCRNCASCSFRPAFMYCCRCRGDDAQCVFCNGGSSSTNDCVSIPVSFLSSRAMLTVLGQILASIVAVSDIEEWEREIPQIK